MRPAGLYHTYIHFFWLVPQRGFLESDLHYIKNPNCWEAADQLAIYKRGRGDESRDCRVTSQYRAGIEPGLSDSKSSVLITRPRCLPELSSA